MRSAVILSFVFGITVTLGLAGCTKKGGKAVVLEKEHIAAKEIISTPAAQESVSPSSPTPGSNEVVSYEEATPRELAEDEIVVDTYVMKKDVRGTSRDPRATSDEQWIVRVEMVSDLRKIEVQTDKARWDKVKIGDRINVSYRQGNYTGTIWASKID